MAGRSDPLLATRVHWQQPHSCRNVHVDPELTDETAEGRRPGPETTFTTAVAEAVQITAGSGV